MKGLTDVNLVLKRSIDELCNHNTSTNDSLSSFGIDVDGFQTTQIDDNAVVAEGPGGLVSMAASLR